MMRFFGVKGYIYDKIHNRRNLFIKYRINKLLNFWGKVINAKMYN